MDDDSQGFLGRWSRRKAAARTGRTPDEPAREDGDTQGLAAADETAAGLAPQAPAQPSDAVTADGKPVRRDAVPASADGIPAGEPPPPTREDLATLTLDSDFSPFMQRAVEPDVKLAALKKLFSDPHYNIMDGLDVYIDDYSSPEKLPASMLRKMVSARVLALVQDDPPASDAGPAPTGEPGSAEPDTTAGAGGSMLESGAPVAPPADDDQTHLDFPEPDRHR